MGNYSGRNKKVYIPLTPTLSRTGRGCSFSFPSLDPVGFADLFEELDGVERREGMKGRVNYVNLFKSFNIVNQKTGKH